MSKYKNGFIAVGDSEKYFKLGVTDVFNNLKLLNINVVNTFLDKLYDYVRCGLYHTGLTEGPVILTGSHPKSLDITNNLQTLVVNPHLLVKDVKKHFDSYITDLRNKNNTDLRLKFERRFDYIFLSAR